MVLFFGLRKKLWAFPEQKRLRMVINSEARLRVNISNYSFINYRLTQMITRQVITDLYKKYRKLPESPDFLDMPLLFDYAATHHNITIDMDGPVDTLVIRSIAPESPFHRIPLERIHAIVPFEEWVAIVLHSSIIFLNRKSSKVSVHIRTTPPTVMDRVRDFFKKD